MNFDYLIERNGSVILGVRDETAADLIAALLRRELGGKIRVCTNEW